ncbi:hypothetical protein EJ110_NYTH43792 [Nymphaea thermarum]|nr:hypothetical protein EJ110_NYTH43792 [Nymphaea thermarum]
MASSFTNYRDDDHNQQSGRTVTSCVYLRSSSSAAAERSQPLDKEMVLRRIRQQKLVNKVQTALTAFFPQPSALFSGDVEGRTAALAAYWMDEPFSP